MRAPIAVGFVKSSGVPQHRGDLARRNQLFVGGRVAVGGDPEFVVQEYPPPQRG